MPTGNAKFEAAAKEALCGMLGSVGGSAASYAAWSLLAPGPFSWGALGLAGIAGLAYANGCQLDPSQSGQQGAIDGCSKVDGFGAIQWNEGSGFVDLGQQANYQDAIEILETRVDHGQNGLWYAYVRWSRVAGTDSDFVSGGMQTEVAARAIKWRLRPIDGACVETDDPDAPPVPPHTYTDPDDGCQISVSFQGFVVGPGGTTGAAWKMEPAAQQRASGGVIGGCNFAPVIYYQPPGGGGGGGGVIPWNPGPDGDGGEPWWMPIVRGLAGGATSAIVNRIVEELFGAKAPGVIYRLVSVCETDAQGEAISQSREVTIPELPMLQGIVARLDAMDDLMQGLKDFKQPVCGRPRPQGQLVTVNFRSMAPSPGGERPLLKQLRYRDNANLPEADHVAHWLGFEWQAGPAIVTSKGAVWGIVEVWAADPAEGRRVIEHAAAIAGVDLTVPDHAWVDSTPRSSRYGKAGTMRVEHTIDGTPCISKRVGPSELPGWAADP